MEIVKSAFVLIEDMHAILLVQEGGEAAHGLWCLPGGHIDGGETLLAGAVREVFEETGQRITLGELIHTRVMDSDEYRGSADDNGKNIEIYIFRGSVVCPPREWNDNEILDVRWFAPSEARALPLRWGWLGQIFPR